jgi:hypothetical protein
MCQFVDDDIAPFLSPGKIKSYFYLFFNCNISIDGKFSISQHCYPKKYENIQWNFTK